MTIIGRIIIATILAVTYYFYYITAWGVVYPISRVDTDLGSHTSYTITLPDQNHFSGKIYYLDTNKTMGWLDNPPQLED